MTIRNPTHMMTMSERTVLEGKRSMSRPLPGRWRTRSACGPETLHLFYPEKSEDGLTDYGPAKKICSGCPVREECLAHALAARELEGVWGGASPSQRRRMRRVVPTAVAV